MTKLAESQISLSLRCGGYEVYFPLDLAMVDSKEYLEQKSREIPEIGLASTMLGVETNYIKYLAEKLWKQISDPPWESKRAEGDLPNELLRAMLGFLYKAKVDGGKTVVNFKQVFDELMANTEVKK